MHFMGRRWRENEWNSVEGVGHFFSLLTECASEKKIIFAGRVVRPEIDQPEN